MYLGNPFEVSKKVKHVLGKVESIGVTRSGFLLVNCVTEEQKKNALGITRMSNSEELYFELKE